MHCSGRGINNSYWRMNCKMILKFLGKNSYIVYDWPLNSCKKPFSSDCIIPLFKNLFVDDVIITYWKNIKSRNWILIKKKAFSCTHSCNSKHENSFYPVLLKDRNQNAKWFLLFNYYMNLMVRLNYELAYFICEL